MRTFVTGATGFVGSHLVDALIARGDSVVCLARDTAKAKRVFAHTLPDIIEGDLSDAAALRAGCTDADLVYHVGGVTSARNRHAFFAVNADGTRQVVEAASHVAPTLNRFVYVSSQAAAGPSKRGRVRTEQDDPAPVSDYGASKLAGEDVVRAARLPWTVIRPTSVYGPRDRDFLTLFKVARTGIVPMLGPSDQELSLIHVDDLIAALLSVVAPQAVHRTYFACHPEVVTARALVTAIYHAARSRPPRRSGPYVFTLPDWATHAVLSVTELVARVADQATTLNRDKANELLAEAWTCSPGALERDTGWRARLSLSSGAQQTAEWYRENRWL